MRVERERIANLVRLMGVVLGVATFVVSNQVSDFPLGFPTLSLSQLWKFQRILRLLGLGLIVVSVAGGFIDKLAKKSLAWLDNWFSQNSQRSRMFLIILMLIYFITYSGVTFYRHYAFNSTGYDLAILDQVVWNTAQGRPFARSIYDVESQLGAHIRPYIFLPSLVYLILPSPYVLLAFQSFVLALTAWPLYRLSKRKFDSSAVALVTAFCGLAYPPLGFLNRFDFHPEVIAVPLLVEAYERLDANDLKGTSILAGLALFAKEDIGVTIAALGLMVAFRYRRWFLGLLSSLASITYSAVALLVIIPFFRGEPSHALSRYGWLGDTPFEMVCTILSRPEFALTNIIEAKRITTLLQLLAPQAFIPILGWPSWILAAPSLLYHYLSHHFCQITIYCQYMVPVIPFVLVSGVLGLHWVTTSPQGKNLTSWITTQRNKPKQQGLGLGISMLLLATLASWTYQNPIKDNSFASPVFLSQPNASSIREGLQHVPTNSDLATTNAYAPHLSHRREMEILMYDRIFDYEAEVLFLNLKDLRWTMSCADYRKCLKLAERSDFGITFYRNGVLVVEKHKGSQKRLRELLNDWPGCE